MPEKVESQNIAEVGKDRFGELVRVLKGREDQGYNSAGWEGTSNNLETQVGGGLLCPASAFAVVAEGMFRYKRQDPQIREDTDSLREFAKVLSDGSEIYGQSDKIDGAGLKDQIKKYVESYGGTFDDKTDWQEFIRTRSERLKSKADLIDEANR
jgi:hypothetical protein